MYTEKTVEILVEYIKELEEIIRARSQKSFIKLSECCKAPMALFSSTNTKRCINCYKIYPWKLKEGIKSPLTGRIGQKEK